MAQWIIRATEQRAGLQIPGSTEMSLRSRHADPLVIPTAWEIGIPESNWLSIYADWQAKVW